ncbi:hypothetical protein Tco_1482094 [Tanacetum coccineum]
MTTLADKAILSGADNRPPMLENDMYDSWKSIMELYMMNRQHGRMILESVENGLLIWLSIEENGVTRPKKYFELSATEAIQADCDIKETNIILQGLPPEVYALVSNHKVAKELCQEIFNLIMQGTSLTKQERESLKDDLRKLKGKALVDNDVTKHPSDPEMLKIDIEPITPKLSEALSQASRGPGITPILELIHPTTSVTPTKLRSRVGIAPLNILGDDHLSSRTRRPYTDFTLLMLKNACYTTQIREWYGRRSSEVPKIRIEAKNQEKEALEVSHLSPHPIIILSDSDVEDTFSSTHSPDYIPASPDYFPASPGNTSSNFLDDLTKDLLASLALSPFYDDPYMKVVQAYDATDNELPIPPQALIAPPTILPPSPVLSLSPMFDFLTFLSSREDFTT